jgi:hypothetical protein
MFDLAAFTLRDMTEVGAVLRKAGAGAASMEEVANRVVRYLHENLVDPRTGESECALVRFFKTHPYGGLDRDLREFAGGLLADAAEPDPEMRCLTLLASAGDRPEWNARGSSVGHRAIPLASEEIVGQAPMISRLLSQLGVRIEALVRRSPELLVEPEPTSFNVFYVPQAKGSSCIPAQAEFVEACGIESVLGFGGMLSSRDIFAVILFSHTPIPRETAELFRTLALNVKVAALDFEEAVFVAQA